MNLPFTPRVIFIFSLIVNLNSTISSFAQVAGKFDSTNGAWIKNKIHGISFETPQKVTSLDIQKPVGFGEAVKSFEGHMSMDGDMITMLIYMETTFVDYDTKGGLNGSVSNMIATMKGSNLNIEYFDPENQYTDARCRGTFEMGGDTMRVEAYLYWRKTDKTGFVLTTFGKPKESDRMKRVIDSFIIE